METFTLCRICLKNRGATMKKIITDEASEHGNLVKEIEMCGGVQINCSTDNKMPNMICDRCLLLLRAACKFRTSCQRSDRLLRKICNKPSDTTVQSLRIDDVQMTKFVNQDEDKLNAGSHSSSSNNPVQTIHFVIGDSDNISHSYIDFAVQQQHDECFQEVATSNDFTDNEQQIHDDELLDSHSITDIDAYSVVEEEEYLEEHVDKINSITVANDQNAIKMDVVDNLGNQYKIIENPNIQSNDFGTTTATAVPSSRELKKAAIIRKRPPNRANKFICSVCGNVYAEKTKLNMHLKMHNKVKPHECEICHKRFAQTPQLSRHMNSHTGNRPYKCSYCTSSFADPSTLCKHERIHTNERPYKCEKCGKDFAYTNVLKVHMMMHAGEKPYQCTYCKKNFSQLHHMRHHEKRHQKVHQEEGTT